MEPDRPGPAPAAPSATIVLVRDAAGGLEALLLKRHHRSGFVPGAYVFPGGRVDPGDARASALSRLRGLTPEGAASRLDLPDADPPAIAYYVAAVREAFEETGILVGSGSDAALVSAAADAGIDRVRDDLMCDRIDFGEALTRLSCGLDCAGMAYIAHWITPEAQPRRYDTRFFLAHVPEHAEAVTDPREMTGALWITPERAIEERGAGRLPMIRPTAHTLERLSAFERAQEALEALEGLSVPTILPVMERGAREDMGGPTEAR